MSHNLRKRSKPIKEQSAPHAAHKDYQPSGTTQKEKDTLIPNKDKSPDDLEIID